MPYVQNAGDILTQNARMDLLSFPKKPYVYVVAFSAAVLAYLSVIGVMQTFTELPLVPLVPMLLFFSIAAIARNGGWVVAAILFVAAYWAICVVMSKPLLQRRQTAQGFASRLYVGHLVLSVVHFVFAVPQGTQLYGPEIPRLVVLLNLAAAIVCGFVLMLWKLRPQHSGLGLASFGGILYWISWAAFPHLGEMP